MSKKDFLKKKFREVMIKTKPIVTTALITGATSVSKEMKVAVSGVNQSPGTMLGKIPASLKRGAVAAGQEMIKNGLQNINKNQE
jgi:hypothetical protein